MRNIPQTIENRINKSERKGRTVLVDDSKAISYPRSVQNKIANSPTDLIWNLRYIEKTLYGTTGISVGDVSFSVGSSALTVAFLNNTGSGVYSNTLFTWTDSSKTWTVDQWAGYYLKVNDEFYRITSNTADSLLLPLQKGDSIQDGTYEIVAFITNMLVGSFLNPDTSSNKRFQIVSNDEFVINIRIRPLKSGVVTTGDASAPYATFRDNVSLANYADDDFVGDTIVGFNAGAQEKRLITSFTAATSEITVDSGFTNPIVISDRFRIVKDMLYAVASTEWRTEKYYPLSASDFENALPSEIKYVRLPASGGKILDNNLKQGYAAMYSIECMSNIKRNVSTLIGSIDSSLRIEIKDLSSGTVFVPVDTGFRPVQPNANLTFVLRANVFYRMDVYMYSETGGTVLGQGANRTFVFDPISKFIDVWRDTRATEPIWNSVTGADSSNVSDPSTMLPTGITLSWENSIFISDGSKTEIWDSDAVDGTFALLVTLSSDDELFTDVLASGADRYYKIRHISATGETGPFTSVRRGIVSSSGAGNAVIDFKWVDNVGTEVFPNSEGFFNDAILKGKITVTSSLTIQSILFTQPSVVEDDLGNTSPATSDAIANETDGDFVYYKVTFTNGESTLRRSVPFRYDKTAPSAPTAPDIVSSVNNLAVLVTIAGTYSLPLDFEGFEWTWNTVNATPPAVSDDPRATTREKILIDLEEADFANSILYVWVRTLDTADNKSAWVGHQVDLSGMSISGSIEVIDLLEMAYDDGLP